MTSTLSTMMHTTLATLTLLCGLGLTTAARAVEAPPQAQSPAPAPAPAPSAQTPPAPAADAPKDPPLKALLIKMQGELLDRERTIIQLQAQVNQLQHQSLEQAKRTVEPEVLKELNAKPGETFDWNALTLRPASAAAPPEAQPQKGRP
jgi:hypothetical protein